MKVAVPTSDGKTVAGHAGQARRWLLITLDPGEAVPTEICPVELRRDQVFHHWDDQGAHPLDGVQVVITSSAGEGFQNRMRKRGVEIVLSGEPDILKAVAEWGERTITPPKPRPIGQWICKLHDLFSKHRQEM